MDGYTRLVPEFTVACLRMVTEVARAGSFSGAAERLGYTQSAVSRQVSVAERVAGTTLFERHSRGVRTTPAGEVLVRHAENVLDSIAAASQELAGLEDRVAGRLAVAGFPTACAVLVPRAIARVREQYPGLSVRLVEGSTPTLLEGLNSGRVGVAVVATGEGLPEYEVAADLIWTPLSMGRGAGVAVAADHRFAGRESIDASELTGENWIAGSRGGDAPQFGAWPGLASPRVGFVARDWATRLGMVGAGLGIALLPGLASESIPRGVAWVPVRGRGLGRTTWVVTARDPTPAAEIMADALDRTAADLTA